MINIIEYRKKYYKLARIFAVFVISPYLIYKGYKMKENLILLIGLLILIWDGLKVCYD